MQIERVIDQGPTENSREEDSSQISFGVVTAADTSEQAARYREFSTRCFCQEIAIVVTLVTCFVLAYLFCYLVGIEYGSFLHGKILYAVFVFFNIYAAGQAFYSWAVLRSKSVARDYMFFWAIAFIGVAIGNSIDYLLWASETAEFKQNTLTNLIFVFCNCSRGSTPT